MPVIGSTQLSMHVTSSEYAVTKKSANWKFLLLCTNEARNDCHCCLYSQRQHLCDASQTGCLVALVNRV